MLLVTGASSPLGIELVKHLLGMGEACILVVRDKKHFESFNELDLSNSVVLQHDLSCNDQVIDLCDKIANLDVELRAFVHLASTSPEDNFDLDEMDKTFNVNVFSAWKLAIVCIAKMAATGGGRILFVGSVGHKFGGKNERASYASSKHLLEYFPRALRECASVNVLINTLRLGVMAGGTQIKMGVDFEAFKTRVDLIPTGSSITHQEAISNIQFLCSMDNLSIHNAVIACTGGE